MSAKRIRKALQELFSVDLSQSKQELKDLIISRFNRQQDLKTKTLKHAELVELDSKIANKLHSKEVKRLKRHKDAIKGIKKAKKKRKTNNENPNSIHKKNVGMSPQLQEFLGEEQMPRTQVVKAVWDYIKLHNLQNPDDRREIICDDAMKPIFGDKMTMFSMNKILSNHLFSLNETSGGNNDDREDDSSKPAEESS